MPLAARKSFRSAFKDSAAGYGHTLIGSAAGEEQSLPKCCCRRAGGGGLHAVPACTHGSAAPPGSTTTSTAAAPWTTLPLRGLRHTRSDDTMARDGIHTNHDPTHPSSRPGAVVPGRPRCRVAAADRGYHQCQPRPAGAACRLPRHLRVRRRRRRGIAGPAGTGRRLAGRRAHRCAAHHRCLRSVLARRHRHRLRARRAEYRAHGRKPGQGGCGGLPYR